MQEKFEEIANFSDLRRYDGSETITVVATFEIKHSVVVTIKKQFESSRRLKLAFSRGDD